jgi:hypothetical protein
MKMNAINVVIDLKIVENVLLGPKKNMRIGLVILAMEI